MLYSVKLEISVRIEGHQRCWRKPLEFTLGQIAIPLTVRQRAIFARKMWKTKSRNTVSGPALAG
jgi:hypothetical protein